MILVTYFSENVCFDDTLPAIYSFVKNEKKNNDKTAQETDAKTFHDCFFHLFGNNNKTYNNSN